MVQHSCEPRRFSSHYKPYFLLGKTTLAKSQEQKAHSEEPHYYTIKP